jgi:hypothetical protein
MVCAKQPKGGDARREGRAHVGCGGRLYYAELQGGYSGYICDRCGWIHSNNKNWEEIMVKELKRVSDIVGKGQFYPEMPKKALNDVLGKDYELTDATIVRDFDSKFGKSNFALLLLTDLKSGEQFTTLCGGMVVVKKVQHLLAYDALPVVACIVNTGRYYDIN